MFLESGWLAFKGQRFLWLPFDYRPISAAVCRNIICLGHASGHVTVFEFNSESMPPHNELTKSPF